MEIPWSSLGFHGLHRIPWNSMEVLGFHGSPWDAWELFGTEFHGIHWNSIRFLLEFHWVLSFVEFHGIPSSGKCLLTDYYSPCPNMGDHPRAHIHEVNRYVKRPPPGRRRPQIFEFSCFFLKIRKLRFGFFWTLFSSLWIITLKFVGYFTNITLILL